MPEHEPQEQETCKSCGQPGNAHTPECPWKDKDKRGVDAFAFDRTAKGYEQRNDIAINKKVKLDMEIDEYLENKEGKLLKNNRKDSLEVLQYTKEEVRKTRETLSECGRLLEDLKAVTKVDQYEKFLDLEDAYTSLLRRYNALLPTLKEVKYDLSNFFHLREFTEQVLNDMKEFQSNLTK